jgi:hypothetical protein
VSVTPGYFVHHRAKGDIGRDSDIQHSDGNGALRETVATENIVLLKGQSFKVWKQLDILRVGALGPIYTQRGKAGDAT